MKLSQLPLLSALVTLPLYSYDLTKVAQDYVAKAEQCKKENNIQKALDYYRNAIALNPNDFILLFNTANELYNNAIHEEALKYYDQALTIRSDVEQVYFNKGIVLTQLNKYKEAADCFIQALTTNPQYTRAYTHAGHTLEKCDKHDEAIAMYKRGIDADPSNADLHYRLACVYRHKDLFHEAIAEFRNAIEKDPKNLVYKLELANTLHLIDASEEALRLYEEVLEHNPKNHHVLYNLGYTVKKMGYIEKAMEIYDKVIEADSEYALARFSRALGYLILGDWKRGWKEYEWRWKAYNETAKKFNAPLWDGSDIRNKKILIYAEQGLGDTIQFIRYAKLVKEEYGAYVIFETQAALKDLLKLCPYLDEVYMRGERLPHFDYQIALMSLPLIFKTDVNTVPHDVPYIYAKPELVKYWAEQLKNDHNFKIGICWQGNPNYSTQFLRQAVAGKSMHVKHFEPIARLKGVTLYNLQKMGGEEQLKELPSDINIVCFDKEFDKIRFMDTLAVMKNLDLIITIDTGTCHVAAALGIPTWNLLPNPADWRWMIDRNDTPWYHNMRLFKQPAPGDWAGAIQECLKALKPILKGKKSVTEVTQEKGFIKERRPYECMKVAQEIQRKYLPIEASNETLTKKDALRTFDINLFNFEQLEDKPLLRAIKQTDKVSSPLRSQDLDTKSTTSDLGNNNNLTTQLIALNKQLCEYEKQLQEHPLSVFDTKSIELMQSIIKIDEQKRNLKNEIKQIAQKNKYDAATVHQG